MQIKAKKLKVQNTISFFHFFILPLKSKIQMAEKQFFLSENNVPYNELFVYGFSVDCVVFGYNQGNIQVLLIERGAEPYKNQWALPGDLVNNNENFRKAAKRILFKLTGLKKIYLEQFFAFGEPQRHPAGRVATVGYFSLVKNIDYHPVASSWALQTQWIDINNLPELAFDHQKIIKKAIKTLRKKVKTEVLGFELLPEKFTLSELQSLYEALLGDTFDKPNFRKKVLGMKILTPLNELQTNVSHRPAKLFQFNKAEFDIKQKSGFEFDL